MEKQELLNKISEAIDKFCASQKLDPNHWGYVELHFLPDRVAFVIRFQPPDNAGWIL